MSKIEHFIELCKEDISCKDATRLKKILEKLQLKSCKIRNKKLEEKKNGKQHKRQKTL